MITTKKPKELVVLLHHVVVSNGKSGRQEAENQEGLGGSLVLDVVSHRVRKQVLELGPDLGQDEAAKNRSVDGLVEAKPQVERHRDLGDIDRPRADVLGGVNSERDWKRLESHGPITFDRFKVIHDGDPESRDRVEDRQDHNVGGQRPEDSLSRPPRQSNVGGTKGVVPSPSGLLELEGGGRVDVRDEGTEDGEGEDYGEFVTLRDIQHVTDPAPSKEQNPNLGNHFRLGDFTGRNRTVGFIDRIDLAVVPVVDRLGVAREARARHEHGQ